MGFLDMLVKTRKWYLRNEDSGETIEGQFAPTNLTRDVGNNYAQHTALNRGKTIIQYLNSKNDTLVFTAGFYAVNALGGTGIFGTDSIEENLEKLISWAKRDPDLQRPPIVTFWIGNGHLEQLSVIDSITGITYGEPTILGDLREVTFTINLLQYEEFSIDDEESFDTRYHRARERDYYEALTQREYGNPLIGDVIRKRHPTQPNLVPGAIVKLPSIEGIRTIRVEPTSIALETGFGRKETPQRTLRLDMFDRRNRTYVSHVVIE